MLLSDESGITPYFLPVIDFVINFATGSAANASVVAYPSYTAILKYEF